MNWITRMYVKANQLACGQTMTEYALILAAVTRSWFTRDTRPWALLSPVC